MAQLRLGYPEIKRRGAEVFQITGTPPAQGALYARRFTLPFPYLCDGDHAVHRRYGLTTKGMLAALKDGLESFPRMLTGIVKGEQPSPLPYLPQGMIEATMEQAMFLVGRDGRVRFRHVADVHAHIPSNEVLLRALDALP
jgi:peroxiredoxin